MHKSLDVILKEWISSDLQSDLVFDEQAMLDTPEQAKLVSQALSMVSSFPLANTDNLLNNALEELIYLAPATEKAYSAAVMFILPQLRRLVDDALARAESERVDADLLVLAVKALIESEQEQADVQRLLDVLRVKNSAFRSELCDASSWYDLFGVFDLENPYTQFFYKHVCEYLPQGFCSNALLDVSNNFWMDHGQSRLVTAVKLKHPYDCVQGVRILESLITAEVSSDDVERQELLANVESAVGALPFIHSVDVEPLLKAAEAFNETDVCIVTAWARIKRDAHLVSDASQQALAYLVGASQDFKISCYVQGRLSDLGLESYIPKEVLDGAFAAKAAMYSGLMNSWEYSLREPTSFELIDERELYWPALKKVCKVYLFAYSYMGEQEEDKELFAQYSFPHYGLVVQGQEPLSLVQVTQGCSIEDVYALHCAWEMQDFSSPKVFYHQRDAHLAKGLALLKKYNPEF